jgi:phytoene dehydrogenase-like protein
MENSYDVIIVGAGHNGLVTAAYLAKAGRRVLVLERRAIPGGTLVTEDFGGFRADMVQSGTLRPDIARALKLELPAPAGESSFVSLLGDSDSLVLDPDPTEAADSIRRFSEKDAQRWPEFVRFMNQAAAFLDESYATIIPPLPKPPLFDALGLAELGLDLRLMGRREMMNIIRALAMSALELSEEYFESDVVRAAVASVGIHGVTLGPLSAGTAFNLIHNWMNRAGLAHRYNCKAGDLAWTLVSAVKSFGGEIRTGSEVKCIQVDNYRTKGVILASGEEIPAQVVVSTADPKHTFLSLVGPLELPPEFVWNVQSIKMRGSVAKIHLGLDGLPDGMAANTTYAVAPSIQHLERAYDAAKYGEISQKPYLEVTTGENVISIHFQFAPYALKDASWQTGREHIEKLAVETLSQHFPDLKSKVKSLKSLTPLDLQSTYGLTEGDLNHGQLMLDQFFFMRPIPGYARHKTPIDGLYLCGSGVHAGGGISGASGRNAARVAMRAERREQGKREQ